MKVLTSKREKKSIPVLGELHSNRTLYAMVFPAVIFFLIFSYLPIVGIYYAFTNYNFVDGINGGRVAYQLNIWQGKKAARWQLRIKEGAK